MNVSPNAHNLVVSSNVFGDKSTQFEVARWVCAPLHPIGSGFKPDVPSQKQQQCQSLETFNNRLRSRMNTFRRIH